MTRQVEKKHEGYLGGLILVIIGLAALTNQFFDLNLSEYMGLLILPGIGVLFLVAGIISRNPGMIIPGGILSGLGLGIFLTANPFEILNGQSEGGVFMLSFALGWVLITVLTAVFTQKTHWWPLIPAAIMGLIGGTILLGGIFETVLSFLGTFWPVALIVLGLGILVRAVRGQNFSQKA